jgi:hypothetical protein
MLSAKWRHNSGWPWWESDQAGVAPCRVQKDTQRRVEEQVDMRFLPRGLETDLPQ